MASTAPPLLDLAGTSYDPATRPSVYELLAADELRELVQPAFRYVLAYLAQTYPRYLLRLVNRHEEVYALALLLVERHHLKKYNASFSDHFYNLRLRGVKAIPTPRRDLVSGRAGDDGLTRRQRWLYLAAIVGIPYLRSKAHALFESLGGGVDPQIANEDVPPDTPRSTRSTFLRKIYLRLYPLLSLAFDAGLLYWDLMYAFDRTRWWRPWLAWIGRGVEVVRDDGQGQLPSLPDATPRSLSARLLAFLLAARHNALPISLLTLKFMQWWFSPGSPRSALGSARGARGRAVVGKGGVVLEQKVAPPRMVRPLPGGVRLGSTPPLPQKARKAAGARGTGVDSDSDSVSGSSSDSDDSTSSSSRSVIPPSTPPPESTFLAYGICPICREPWANPSMLSTGYVACYLCLYDSLSKQAESDAEKGGASEEPAEGDNTAKRICCPITGVWLPGGIEEIRKVLP